MVSCFTNLNVVLGESSSQKPAALRLRTSRHAAKSCAEKFGRLSFQFSPKPSPSMTRWRYSGVRRGSSLTVSPDNR